MDSGTSIARLRMVKTDRAKQELEPWPTQIDQQIVVQVEINSLSAADSPRLSGEVSEHVEALSVAETPLPPIIVHRSTMRVIDGVHRLRAAELRGDDKIAVTFFDGTDADAFVLAVESNIAHGLPLSMADRKRAARRIIASHPQWSDRMIASVTGMASATVGEIRGRMPGGDPVTERRRMGRDGRVRPLSGAEGRRRASEIIAENPGLSLRQIAHMAGISPETVRDVRNRLRRGEDPLPKPRRKEGKNQETKPTGTPSGSGEGSVPYPASMPDGATRAVERLAADPALRFSETGRMLLRLLSLHTISAEEWKGIIGNLPPHDRDIVAQLAGECAEMWVEFAVRIERMGAESRPAAPTVRS